GQDGRDLQRMSEIGIARGALLAAVRLHREHIGAIEQILVGVRIVAADPLDQFVLPHHLLKPSQTPAGDSMKRASRSEEINPYKYVRRRRPCRKCASSFKPVRARLSLLGEAKQKAPELSLRGLVQPIGMRSEVTGDAEPAG